MGLGERLTTGAGLLLRVMREFSSLLLNGSRETLEEGQFGKE